MENVLVLLCRILSNQTKASLVEVKERKLSVKLQILQVCLNFWVKFVTVWTLKISQCVALQDSFKPNQSKLGGGGGMERLGPSRLKVTQFSTVSENKMNRVITSAHDPA